MSGIVGSRLNIRGSGLVGSLGTDGQALTSSGAGTGMVFEAAGGFGVGDITGATALAATPATTDEFILSDGGVLKRMDYDHILGIHKGAFMARESGDVTITSNTHTLCPNDQVVYDPESLYDNSAGEYHYTAPATGYYFFFQENKVTHSDGKGQMVIWPKKNSSDSGAIQYGSTVTFQPSGGGEKDALKAWTLNSHWIMSLSAGDEISFWVYVYSWDAEDGTINYYSNFAGGWRLD